jgi:hypothetical protein
MLEQERFDAIKRRVESAQEQFAAGQLVDATAEAAEYVGHLEGAIREAEDLKSDLEVKLKKRKRRRGAKTQGAERSDPYGELLQSVADYLACLRSETGWERRRLETSIPEELFDGVV